MKQQDLEKAEEYLSLANQYSTLAAEHLFRAQWSYQEPEWYDHRLHLLDPKHHWTDFWTMSADSVIRVLPLHGRLLDLCSGDGFYDYYWFAKRAQVVCVDWNLEAHEFAIKNYSHPNIRYINADVRQFAPDPESFDVVLIRGAIEHFAQADQQTLFRNAYEALKPGGYFCGDTVAANPRQDKLLKAHECEWKNEIEMHAALNSYAPWADSPSPETWSIESDTSLHSDTPNGTPGMRTSLFWRYRKPI